MRRQQHRQQQPLVQPAAARSTAPAAATTHGTPQPRLRCCEPPSTTAKLWAGERYNGFNTVGVVDYPWPEQQLPGFQDTTVTANIGVCVSGGGCRSYAAGYGQMRALHNLHHLKRTRYLAGVSGGSWLTAVTVYNQNDTPDSVFYGASPPPEELTMAQLAELPKESLGYGATRDMFFGLLPRAARAGCLGCWTGDPGQVWSQSLGDAVLQPYGLGGDQFFTWNEQSREEALARNRHLKASDFLLPREGAPFLILSTSSLGPPKDGSLLAGSGAPLLSSTKNAFTNMESTPLYVGYPLLQDVDVTYADGSTATVTKGGMIEPFAYGGAAAGSSLSDAVPGASAVVEGLPPPELRWSLKQAAGASSVWGERDLYWLTASTDPSTRNDDRCQFGGGLFCCLRKYAVVTTGTSTIVDGLTKLLDVPLVGPLLPDWPKMAEQPQPPPSSRYRQGDGDLEGDILAQYNVLVRSVDHEVCFLNTSQPLAPRDKWDPYSETSEEELRDSISSFLPPLFGLSVGADRWGWPERDPATLRVFRESDFGPFVRAMQDSMADGKTAVVRMTLTTVGNDYMGVAPGKRLDLCLFYLSSSKEWEAQLPQDTRDQLAKGDDGPFAGFPHFGSFLPNPIVSCGAGGECCGLKGGLTSLTNEQTNLLAGLTDWAVMKNKELLADMFE